MGAEKVMVNFLGLQALGRGGMKCKKRKNGLGKVDESTKPRVEGNMNSETCLRQLLGANWQVQFTEYMQACEMSCLTYPIGQLRPEPDASIALSIHQTWDRRGHACHP